MSKILFTLFRPLALASLYVCSATARAHLRGMAAYEREDYAAALRLLELPASRGLSEAQLRMGLMHLMGDGTPPDDVQAAQWLQQAAQNGEPEAQFALARMYVHGRGVPVDYERAGWWCTLAAGQGHADAGVYWREMTRLLRSHAKAADIGRASELAEDMARALADPECPAA